MKEPTLSRADAAERREQDYISFGTAKKIAVVVALLCLSEILFPQRYGKVAESSKPWIPIPEVNPRVGWWLLEFPVTAIFFTLFWIIGQPNSRKLVPMILGTIFSCHYLYRGWYFPYNLRVHPDSTNGFSLFTAIGGWLVTITHGYLNAKWFGKYGARLASNNYLKSARFWTGLLIYETGFWLIVQQDALMFQIRDQPGARRYEIPMGGLWDYSTSANYLAELLAWFGLWVLSDFGPNGSFIFFVSAFNLVPRALTNYNWYVAKFGDEFTSLNRAILIPGVW